MNIVVYTADERLWQRVRLCLVDTADYIYLGGEGDFGRAVVILDTDTVKADIDADILLSRRGMGGALMVPFSFEDLKNEVKRIEKRHTGSLILLEGERAVRLFGEIIRLTDVEYRLLSALLSERAGVFVSRERLIKEVWRGECDGGVVNVYIHYLREKLEKSGEKIIISSRREGYMIDERYRR